MPNLNPAGVPEGGGVTLRPFRWLGSHFWTFPQKQRKILDSLRAGTQVLFNSVPFEGYLFLLDDRLCHFVWFLTRYPSMHGISFGWQATNSETCPCPSYPYVGFLYFRDYCLSHESGKCFCRIEVLSLCLSILVCFALRKIHRFKSKPSAPQFTVTVLLGVVSFRCLFLTPMKGQLEVNGGELELPKN